MPPLSQIKTGFTSPRVCYATIAECLQAKNEPLPPKPHFYFIKDFYPAGDYEAELEASRIAQLNRFIATPAHTAYKEAE